MAEPYRKFRCVICGETLGTTPMEGNPGEHELIRLLCPECRENGQEMPRFGAGRGEAER